MLCLGGKKPSKEGSIFNEAALLLTRNVNAVINSVAQIKSVMSNSNAINVNKRKTA